MSDPTSSPEDRPAPDAGPTDRPPSEAGDGPKKRRRGSRGGRNRSRSRSGSSRSDAGTADVDRQPDELPDRVGEGRPRDPAVAEKALVRRSEASDVGARPRIGDSRPAPTPAGGAGDGAARRDADGSGNAGDGGDKPRRRRGRGRGRSGGGAGGAGEGARPTAPRARRTGGAKGSNPTPIRPVLVDEDPLELDEDLLEARRGRERKGRPVGRYL